MPSNTEGQTLLEAVWSQPTDRAVLSVYADWLIEHGEATRGEFIQLALVDQTTSEQRDRRQALLKKHRGGWLGAARPFVTRWEDSEDSPGFVSAVRCAPEKLVKGFDGIRGLGPRLTVATGVCTQKQIKALAGLPLGKLYGFELCDTDARWLKDPVLTLIAPAMRGLRSLVVHANEGATTVAAFCAMLVHLEGLEALDLTMGLGDGLHPDGWVEALLDSHLVSTLKYLRVPGSYVSRPVRERVVTTLAGCVVDFGNRGPVRLESSGRYRHDFDWRDDEQADENCTFIREQLSRRAVMSEGSSAQGTPRALLPRSAGWPCPVTCACAG